MENWTLERDESGIAWLTLDVPGAPANTLSAPVMGELGAVLGELDARPPQGLVIRSGKAAGFVAGADIEEFSHFDAPGKGRELAARGWRLFGRLAAVPYPTLALIRGHCLGGGLELALACRYRIAADEAATRLGLPEVLLGIFPGWGGMARLPVLIGPPAALDLMLTGRTVDGAKAKRLGLVDLCLPPRVMEAAARDLVRSGRPPHRAGGLAPLLNAWPLKGLVAAQARKKLAAKARPEHYPAPYAILDFWARHGGNALEDPEAIDRLVAAPTTRNLVRIFFLQERLKGFGKGSDFRAGRVHVVGAGAMGGDIAAWCALKGLTVSLQDQGMERIAPALGRARQLFARRLKDPRLIQAAFDRLIPDPAGAGAAHADVVIEAIFEDRAAKEALFRDLEPRLKPGAVLATNTSSLRLEDLGAALRAPERLVGIHFFNPVAKMPLVEVVAGRDSDPAALGRAAAFVRQIDKLPLPVKSAPGFLVNAVLTPYLLEAMRCVDEGLAPATVDAALEGFGMAMGPLELVDTVGLDIALAAGRQLAGEAGVPRCLTERVARGDLGRKSGKGFYAWAAGRPQKPASGQVPAGLLPRLLQPFIERTESLVAEGVVADADLADAGVIFGTGFPPYTGGPLAFKAGGGQPLAIT